MTPFVEMALDNFAVYLTWNISDATLYATRASSSSQLQGQGEKVGFRIDYASLIRESVLNPALVGLIPAEPAVWSNTETLSQVVSSPGQSRTTFSTFVDPFTSCFHSSHAVGAEVRFRHWISFRTRQDLPISGARNLQGDRDRPNPTL